MCLSLLRWSDSSCGRRCHGATPALPAHSGTRPGSRCLLRSRRHACGHTRRARWRASLVELLHGGECLRSGPSGRRNSRPSRRLVRACPVFEGMRGYYPELIGCVRPPAACPPSVRWDVALLDLARRKPSSAPQRGNSRSSHRGRSTIPGQRRVAWIRVNARRSSRLVVGEDKEGSSTSFRETRRESRRVPGRRRLSVRHMVPTGRPSSRR